MAAKPAALATQMIVMMINDFAWVIFWVLFFDRVGTLGGWDRDSIIVLQAVLTTAGGLSLGLLANGRRIGAMAVGGDLDAVLALPGVAAAASCSCAASSRSTSATSPSASASSSSRATPRRRARSRSCSWCWRRPRCSPAFLVLTGALAFFIGRSESGELGFHSMLLLGAYPVDLFAGAIRVMLFTVVPAALIAAVPAGLIGEFDVGRALALVVTAAVFAARRHRHLHPRPPPLHLRQRLDPRLTVPRVHDVVSSWGGPSRGGP